MKPRALDLLPQRILGRIVRGEGCWAWTGWHNQTYNGGYGYVRWKGKDMPVHRLLYETIHGPQADKDIDHLCRNPRCVNPDHLEAVTHQVNLRRGKAATKTSCKRGHDWTNPKNVYRRKNGVRWCAACARELWSGRKKIQSA